MKVDLPQQSLRYRELLYSLFSVASLASLVVATNFFDPINLPKLIGIITPIPWLALNFARFSNFKLDREFFREWPRRIFLISLALLCLLLVLSPAPLERRFLGTWGRNNGLATSIVSVFIAWCAYELGKKTKEPLKLVFLTNNILLITAVYGLIQSFDLDPINWSSGSMRIFATFGNTNFASAAWALGAMCSSVLLLFGRTSYAKSKIQFIFYIVTLITFSYLAFMTKSIQGLFALTAFYVALVILKLWFSRILLLRICSSILTLLGLVVAYSIFFTGPFSTFISTAGSLGFRKIYWSIGWNMFMDKPILGVGVDSYGDFYRTYRTSDMASTTSIDLVVNNAHNTFVQSLATLGIVGGLALFIPVVMTMFFGIRHLVSKQFGVESVFFVLFISLWLMASFSIDNISITIWNWLFLGFSLGLILKVEGQIDEKTKQVGQVNSGKSRLYDHSSLTVKVLTLLLITFLWINVSAADRKLISTFRTPASFDRPESISSRLDSLGEISRLGILDPQHFMMLGRALVELQQVPQAIDVLSKGTVQFPRDFFLWDNLAYSLEQQGRIREAISAREKQVELDPRHARIWSYLAQDYQRIGDQVSASRAAQQSLANLSVFSSSEQATIRSFLSQLGLI